MSEERKYATHYKSRLRHEDFVQGLREFVKENEDCKEIVIACIGTDRLIGDSLGPLVGSLLKEIGIESFNVRVEGTLENPLHAMNLPERMQKVPKNAFVIAVDACLGKETSIGTIAVREKAIKPGAGVGKDLGKVGDISIIGTVSSKEMLKFHAVRLGTIMKMAKIISIALYNVLEENYIAYEKVAIATE